MNRFVSVLLLAATPAMSSWASEEPWLVSPGGREADVHQDDCPTFSWAPVAGADAHELVIYRIDEDDRVEVEPAVRAELPGAAASWTPPIDLCLTRGEHYAWAVRAKQRGAWRDWSEPSRFEITEEPASTPELEAAVAKIIERYVEEGRLEGRGEERRIRVPDLPPPVETLAEPPRTAAAVRPRSTAKGTAGSGFRVATTGDVTASSFTGNGSARVGGAINNGSITVSSTSYVSLLSHTINAPNDGSLLIVGTVEMFCTNFTSAGDTAGSVSFDVDELTGWSGIDYPLGIPDCLDDAGGVAPERFVTVTHVIPVTAGSHTVYILGKKEGGSQHPTFSDRTLSVLFID